MTDLDSFEQGILNSIENDEWKSIFFHGVVSIIKFKSK